jgi:hypothetical protein
MITGSPVDGFQLRHHEVMLDSGFLDERGVTFPAFDTEHAPSGEPTWNGWIESSSTTTAVSVIHGVDPSDPAARLADDDTGLVVWSFDPRQLQGDAMWPANHASLFIGLQFAHHRGITLGEGSSQMNEVLQRPGQRLRS